MAAAEDSKSFGSDTVWVRLPSWPPIEILDNHIFVYIHRGCLFLEMYLND